ncbi:hypothetical protein ES703_51192 [subsurface metagenome]
MINDSDFNKEFKREFKNIVSQDNLDINNLSEDQREQIEFLAYKMVVINHHENEWLDYFDRKDKEARKRENLERQKLYAKNNPAKIKAQGKLRYAIKTGKIKKPNICSNCNLFYPLRKIQSHHKDYNKPLDVEWFCPYCHRRLKHAYISF